MTIDPNLYFNIPVVKEPIVLRGEGLLPEYFNLEFLKEVLSIVGHRINKIRVIKEYLICDYVQVSVHDCRYELLPVSIEKPLLRLRIWSPKRQIEFPYTEILLGKFNELVEKHSPNSTEDLDQELLQ